MTDASPEIPVHWHDTELHGYVMEGETYILDEEGMKIPVGPGDRMVIPKGAWHAEGEVKEKVVYIVTTREAVPFNEGIMPREPKGPFPKFS